MYVKRGVIFVYISTGEERTLPAIEPVLLPKVLQRETAGVDSAIKVNRRMNFGHPAK